MTDRDVGRSIMDKVLTLELKGDRVTTDNVRGGVVAFFSLLDEVVKEITGNKRSINWVVNVKGASVGFACSPEPTKRIKPEIINDIIYSVENGIDALEKAPDRPPYFNDKALEFAQDLANLPSRKGNGLVSVDIRIGKNIHSITRHSAANVDFILGYAGQAIGSVEGRLETITERGGFSITVFDALTDRAVKCSMEEEKIADALHYFGKRVSAWGLIRYGRDGHPKSIRVEERNVFKEEGFPTAKDVLGIIGK